MTEVSNGSTGTPQLARTLGLWAIVGLGLGYMTPTVVFDTFGIVSQETGHVVPTAYLLALVVMVFTAISYGRMTRVFPSAGSAYTYSYAVMGEPVAWLVGWALILEYALGASAVAVGWSGHMVGLLDSWGLHIPHALTVGPKISIGFISGGEAGGMVNLPAVIVSLFVTALLILGTKESANFNAVLVAVKVTALSIFVVLTSPLALGHSAHFHPFAPQGWGQVVSSKGTGVLGAAASIFFAYVGFDAVSTAAEETRNPQRNVPIGLMASLLICTVFYLLVAAGVIGAFGAQPVADSHGAFFPAGAPDLYSSPACNAPHAPLVCSKEALAYVLREVGYPRLGDLLGLAAAIALPSVALLMMYGQTRVFFVMARDGLLPRGLSAVHPKFKTPWIITLITGVAVSIAAAFLPVGSRSNAGTLFAFAVVSLGVMILRFTDKTRHRPFKTPFVFVIAPLSIFGCIVLFLNLDQTSKMVFSGWTVIGIVVYFAYGFWNSNARLGFEEDVPLDDSATGQPPA